MWPVAGFGLVDFDVWARTRARESCVVDAYVCLCELALALPSPMMLHAVFVDWWCLCGLWRVFCVRTRRQLMLPDSRTVPRPRCALRRMHRHASLNMCLMTLSDVIGIVPGSPTVGGRPLVVPMTLSDVVGIVPGSPTVAVGGHPLVVPLLGLGPLILTDCSVSPVLTVGCPPPPCTCTCCWSPVAATL